MTERERERTKSEDEWEGGNEKRENQEIEN